MRATRRANEGIERDSPGRYKIQCSRARRSGDQDRHHQTRLLKDGMATNANISKSANIKFEN